MDLPSRYQDFQYFNISILQYFDLTRYQDIKISGSSFRLVGLWLGGDNPDLPPARQPHELRQLNTVCEVNECIDRCYLSKGVPWIKVSWA